MLDTPYPRKRIAVRWLDQRRRYRLEASTHDRNHPIRPAIHANLNREFRGPRYIEWQSYLIPLLDLTIIDFFYFQRWG